MRLCSEPGFSVALVLFVGPLGLLAQAPANNGAQLQPTGATSVADSRVVLLPVLVVDDTGRAVTALSSQNFSVTEDGRPEIIRNVAQDDSPYSIGILLDLSGSMNGELPLERDAVLQFLRYSNPQDEFFLIGFSDRPELIVNFTTSREAIAAGFDALHGEYRTALYDAIYAGLDKMREARYPRQVLFLISDGGENASHHSESDIGKALRQNSVRVETIGMFDPRAPTTEDLNGLDNLHQIIGDSGGRLVPLDGPSQAAQAGAAMAASLRLSYQISYTSDSPTAGGEWRKVKVKLSPPKGKSHLTVYARSGYYAPSQ